MPTLLPRAIRSLGGLALAAGCALAAAAPAHAASVGVSATCAFSPIGTEVITFDVVYPDNLVGGDAAPAGKLTNIKFPAGITGLAPAVELVSPSFVSTTVKPPVGAPERPGFGVRGILPLPSEIYGGMFSFGPGQYTATIDSLYLNLRATTADGKPLFNGDPLTDGDNNPETIGAQCSIAGTPTVSFTVGPYPAELDATAPTPPSAVTVSALTAASATVRWTPSTDAVGVDRYSVQLIDPAGAIRGMRVSGTEAKFHSLKPGTTYKVSVIAIDRAANVSQPGATTFRTPAPSTKPKISGYSVTGGFTIWVEPATQPGEPRQACIVASPKIVLTGSGFTNVAGGAKLYFQGLWQTKYGFGVPFPGGLLRASDDSVVYLRDEEILVDAASALQLTGWKGSAIVADRSGLPKSGRITLLAWYAMRQRIAGTNVTVPTLLPTKRTSFAFLDKPAGACTGAGGSDLLLKS